MKRILLTGASGFVGSHVLRHLLVNTEWEIVCPVTFRHKGNSDRIASALESNPEWHERVHVIMCDLSRPLSATTKMRFGEISEIWNVASESHVDRSIELPGDFIQNNVALMTNLLDYARELNEWGDLQLFLQMSTDEVYGPAPEGYAHKEWDTIMPSNPYSASKAAQEAIAFSYWRTYGLPIVITNTMNIIGEMQDPEKFVPMIIKKIFKGQSVPVHVSPEGKSGSRFYLHARNLADAWLFLSGVYAEIDPALYPHADRPDRYHIVGEQEISNHHMVELVANAMGRNAKIQEVNFHQSRPGHDLRYALDGDKLKALGWEAPVPLEESLYNTVHWTLKHAEWLL